MRNSRTGSSDDPHGEAASRPSPKSQEHDRRAEEDRQLADRLAAIRHKVIVLSGKGGVGKSTIAASLAVALARRGKSVGILDADLHGPSIPHLLGIATARMSGSESAIQPATTPAGLRVVSAAFLLRNPDDALIWRGPLKHSIIRQFIANTEWGDLDYLIVDSPPGTGDEPLSVAQLLTDADGAVVVTTPQEVAVIDVRKAVGFLRKLGLPILGVIENMSGYVCPRCGAEENVFGRGGGERIAEDMEIPFAGRVPIDPALVRAADAGALEPYLSADTAGARAFASIVERLVSRVEDSGGVKMNDARMPVRKKIAVPVEGGRLAAHFGHCSAFELFETDAARRGISRSEIVEAPPHEPGRLPAWLSALGVEVVIAGGMGRRAQDLFRASGIDVIVGAPGNIPRDVVQSYLEGTLETGDNVCDH